MTFAAYCMKCRGFNCECEPLVAAPPAVDVSDEMVHVAMAAYDRRTGNGSRSDYPGIKAALVAALKAVKS